jgi:hypothetical protein
MLSARFKVADRVILTKLNPKIILHQNNTLFNNVRLLTQGSLCTMTMGICIIIIKNP